MKKMRKSLDFLFVLCPGAPAFCTIKYQFPLIFLCKMPSCIFPKICYNNNCQEGIHPEADTETKGANGRTETTRRKVNPKNFLDIL